MATELVAKNINLLNIAIPQLDNAGRVEGWFVFNDAYMSPSVQYTSEPPRTLVTLGSRKIEIDRAVPLKIRLLEAEEDYKFWCRKGQHSQRVSCGEYHSDFGDVEVGYSFSSPQTHIWFAGYAIHAECLENLAFTSNNSTICVTPEHVMNTGDFMMNNSHGFTQGGPHNSLTRHDGKQIGQLPYGQQTMNNLELTQSLFELVINEGADFPIYATAVPVRVHTSGGYVTEMVPTVEFVNDCERDIRKVEAFDIGVGVSSKSSPTAYPPTYPAPRPFEHASLFWSYVHNKLLKKRLVRDEMEQAAKDIALLIRAQNVEDRTEKEDRRYREAMLRLSRVLASERTLHQLAYPNTDLDDFKCSCQMCKARRRRGGGHRDQPRLKRLMDSPAAPRKSQPESHHHHPPPPHHHEGGPHDHHHQRRWAGGSSYETPGRNSARSSRQDHYHQYDTADHKCAVCRTKEPETPWSERADQAEAGNALINLCLKKQKART